GNLPAQGGFGGPGTGASIVDGFGIEWKYPGSARHTRNDAAPADKQNFSALMAEFRSEVDAPGRADETTYALSAAIGADQDKIQNVETDKLGQYLTFLDVMTYDMHGAWDAT
ncbi:glycosyl hydrolase family 18 protein, partial [Saccharothrix sp. ST-888]|uniref:glycosyl hydrolase family 18 protein n=1 Tax=Saccharothrix sp. ST-888 TaxID=1427391 RepID=UPI0005EC88CC